MEAERSGDFDGGNREGETKPGNRTESDVSPAQLQARNEELELRIADEESALVESERHFETLFNNVGDAIFIYNLEGRFLEVNEEACSRLGYTREELLTMSPIDITTEEIAALVPSRLRKIRENGSGMFEAVQVRRDGSELPIKVSARLIEYRLADELPLVEADATQLRQVIMNLITNASEAIGDTNGLITIRTGTRECDQSLFDTFYFAEGLPSGSYAYLEVTDNGCGMNEETLQLLFDPFFTTKFTGRGLGLAAVMGIVRGHKGALHITTESGKGTTFQVVFPSVGSAVKQEPQLPNDIETWRSSGTILVVDDEEKVRTLAGRMLERIGFDALMAHDGVDALEVYQEHSARITCVILDLTMPRMDGAETFRQLRSLRKDLPIIFSSGYDEEEVLGRLQDQQDVNFIHKPYKFVELKAKIRDLVDASNRPAV